MPSLSNHLQNVKEHDNIQQIIGRPPGFLLHWGISMVFIVIALLLTMAWLVKYPDIISSRVVLTTENPPIRVVTRANGKLEKLLVAKQTSVEKNAVLAVLESTAKHTDVTAIEGYLQTWKPFAKLPIQSFVLGDLQSFWAIFLQKNQDYQFFIQNDLLLEKTKNLTTQIQQIEALNTALEQQANTLKDISLIAAKAKQRVQELVEEKAASTKELEVEEMRYLEAKQRFESNANSIINNKIRIEQLRAEQMRLREQFQAQDAEWKTSLHKEQQQLQAAIVQWKQIHLITAPIAGTLSFTADWTQQQYIPIGTSLMTIVPEGNTSGTIRAKAVLPTNRSGKVTVGMLVNIRLDAYPYQEYGVLKGKVTQISPVPENEFYQLEVELQEGMKSSYHKTIAFQQEMQGTGNIITEKRRLLERLFDRIWSALED